MDRSASPWHVLDGTEPASPAAGPPPSRPVRWPILGGIVAAAGLFLVALGLVVSGPQPQTAVGVGVGQLAAAASIGPGPTTPIPTTLVVHVAGAVRRPGLVRLAAGSRVADAIEAAGGLGPRVDAARVDRELNLAATVADGDRILVPSRDDTATTGPGATSGGAAAGSSPGRVDLNHASAEALDTLPGIGPATAAKIIAAREEKPFSSLDELVSRKVLGQATLTKIKGLVELR
jgi:competence protein ComEA